MLTTLWLNVENPFPSEDSGVGTKFGELNRYDSDISQPLTVLLASNDESEIVVPVSVTIPANETSVVFPIDAVDDNLLDGEQFVIITATAGPDSTDAYLLVQDYETATVTLDQSALQPGDVLTGTVTVSVP